VIATIVFALIFPTLRLYMAQQDQRAQLREQVAAAAAANEELVAALQRWEDPAYVKAQARQRLSFAMPGDRTFRVSDPENAPALETEPPPAPPSVHLAPDNSGPEADPWYAKLWESAVVAGSVDQP
jgi:type II secretory pathway pseudopilin PulG